jgi:hypothetical protein
MLTPRIEATTKPKLNDMKPSLACYLFIRHGAPHFVRVGWTTRNRKSIENVTFKKIVI